jgi:phage protein D
MKVEALAKSILMNKDPKSRVFSNMTTDQIVQSVAAEYGMSVAKTLVNQAAAAKAHEDPQTIQQAKMTDAQFLAHLARREGLVFHVNDAGVHFGKRNMGGAPVRRFEYYTDPGQGDVLDFNVENDVTMVPGLVEAKGRDPRQKRDIHEVGSNSDTQREGHRPITHTVDPRSLTTQTVPIAQRTVMVTTTPSAAAAKRQADGKYARAQQATVHLSLTTVGDPLVHATQVIEIAGISKRLSGKYYVKAAKHKLSSSGYTMELGCQTDGSQGSPAAAGEKSKAALNKKDEKDPKALAPTTVFIDGRSLTAYRKSSG